MDDAKNKMMTVQPEKISFFSRIKKVFSKDKNEYELLLQHIREAQRKGIISLDSFTMIEGVLQVAQMRVRDIMVPRSHVVAIHTGMGVNEMLSIVAASGHSRFPVVDESLDDVEGILLAKDLAHYQNTESLAGFELKDIMRPAVFVPESKRLNILLKDFRKSRNHMAIVIDEYSGVSGVVTIEDVLEEIVGEIDDEHDAADVTNIARNGFKRYSVRGLTPIDEFNQFFGEKFSADKFDTMAGLVTHELGHLPQRGEEVTLGKYHFKIISANSRRINTMQLTLLSAHNDVRGETAMSTAGSSADTKHHEEA